MAVEKFGGAIVNDPGAIVHNLTLIWRESVITPIMIVDRADGTKVVSSLQLLSEMGRARYKEQSMHLIWGADKGKYTPLMENLRDNLLKGHNNYLKTVSEAYSLLLK